MPKENYNFLTDATREALTDKVKPMAHGWNKSVQFIYQILAEEKDDYFAAFFSMYQGACKGGVSTAAWDNELAFARKRYERAVPLSPVHELGNLSKEITDVVVAHCKGIPVLEQLKEIEEAEAQLARYKAAILSGQITR